MRKTSLFPILLVFGAALLTAAPRTYTVSFLVGTAWVKSAAAWESLKMGDLVSLGDSIKVDTESRIELADNGQAIVKIGAGFKNKLTPRVLAALRPPERDASTLSKLVRSKSEMETQTPTAVAAIRGKAVGQDPVESDEAEFLTESELTALLQEDGKDAGPADLSDSDPEANARALLAEAIKLRAQVDQLLKEDRVAAALTTLNLSEKLTQQALNLLENGVVD